VTATQEAPDQATPIKGVTPNIDVVPIQKRPRKAAPWPLDLYQTAVGKKWVMAITGLGLMGFVVAHMIGNLKMFLGQAEYNAYSESLRSLLHPIVPDHTVLWIMRIGLIAMFAIHLHAAYSLTMMNRRARPTSYAKRDYVAANWAARTMRWSGILVLAFLALHLPNLTWAWFPSGLRHNPPADVYFNVVTSLKVPWIAIAYIVGQLALGVHLFHGSWSIFQSLGINNPRFNRLRKGFAYLFTAIVVIPNLSFPIAVLAGVVKLPAS
jgi:succinate dehydrogenase / fumarate reductase, cytochrome b subunit